MPIIFILILSIIVFGVVYLVVNAISVNKKKKEYRDRLKKKDANETTMSHNSVESILKLLKDNGINSSSLIYNRVITVLSELESFIKESTKEVALLSDMKKTLKTAKGKKKIDVKISVLESGVEEAKYTFDMTAIDILKLNSTSNNLSEDGFLDNLVSRAEKVVGLVDKASKIKV